MSQKDCYPRIAPLAKSELIAKNVLDVPPAVLQHRLRAFLGSCLWITQTRFDISYSSSTLGSLLPEALMSIDSLKLFCALAGETYARITNQHAPLRYVPFLSRPTAARFPQIFSFPDASLATGLTISSVEAGIVVFGIPVHRDGLITCFGNLSPWRSRKITRVCRSSAQSEAVALSTV